MDSVTAGVRLGVRCWVGDGLDRIRVDSRVMPRTQTLVELVGVHTLIAGFRGKSTHWSVSRS